MASALLLALLLPGLQEDPAALRAKLRHILDTETDRRGVNPDFEKWKRDLWKSEPKPPRERRPSPAPPSPSAVEGAGQVFLWATLAVCMAGLAFAAWSLLSRDQAAALAGAPGPAAPATDTGPVDALKKSPDAWLADARASLAAGDARAAVRLALLAILAMLHRSRRLAYEKSMTNRECVRAFHGPDEQRRSLSSVVALFETAWYGGLPVDAKEGARALEAARAFGTETPDGGTPG